MHKMHITEIPFLSVLLERSMLLGKSKTSAKNVENVKILKENVNFFMEYVCIFYNHAITTSNFPSFLRMADITPIFMTGNKNKKELLVALKMEKVNCMSLPL